MRRLGRGAAGLPQPQERGKDYGAARQVPNQGQPHASLYCSGPPRLQQRTLTCTVQMDHWHMSLERQTSIDGCLRSSWSRVTQTETQHRVEDTYWAGSWPTREAGKGLLKEAALASGSRGPGSLRRVASECFMPTTPRGGSCVPVPPVTACRPEADAEAAASLLGAQVRCRGFCTICQICQILAGARPLI